MNLVSNSIAECEFPQHVLYHAHLDNHGKSQDTRRTGNKTR